MQIGSLFAGVGGIELGFKQAEFSCNWAVEIDSKACITYRANHSSQLINDDINNVDLKTLSQIDVLVAGFPCQAFSVAGYRRGFEDARGNVFFGILRYLEHFKPKIVFLENVKNLQTHDSGKTLQIILNELSKLGYYTKYKVLNTAKYGNIPQNRERIYIVGFLDQEKFDKFSFPSETKLTKISKICLMKKLVKIFITQTQKSTKPYKKI